MGFPDIMGDESERISEDGRLLESFTDPSTFPHFISMVFVSSFLYLMMKIQWFGINETGSLAFLSLSLTYVIAAIINPTRIGHFLLNVDHGSGGIFNTGYWKKSARVMIVMSAICISVMILLHIQLGDYNGGVILFMGSLFLVMSFGQAISIVYGGIAYSNGLQLTIRSSRSSNWQTAFRVVTVVLLFTPLIWWMSYTSQDSGKEFEFYGYEGTVLNLMLQLVFLVFLGLIVAFLDRITSDKRKRELIDGRAADKFMMIVILTCCWHLFSAWRRNPFTQAPSQSSILIEEGVLMAITILLAVWTISNKGRDKGWSIFQGQSAVYWGICFGYAYGGSIASLSSLSEGVLDLVTITALGHLVTGLSALVLLPITIGYVGFVGQVTKQLEYTVKKNEELVYISDVVEQNKLVQRNTSQESDLEVELLD